MQIYQFNNKIKLLTHNDYVQQTSCNQINKQTDTEKEIDNVTTDNKDDRRIHRMVFICKKKNYNKLLGIVREYKEVVLALYENTILVWALIKIATL